MPLTDTAARQAKPAAKPRKLVDAEGMYLLIQPSGSKLWRLDYRYQGKRKTLALGAYPAVSLAAARKLRDQAREQLAAGTDPGAAKKEAKRAAKIAAANSFEAVSRAWWETWRTERTKGTADAALRALENHVFPNLGDRPVTAITPVDVLEVLRRIDAKGATDMLKRIRARIGEVFIYAIAPGAAKSNPAEAAPCSGWDIAPT